MNVCFFCGASEGNQPDYIKKIEGLIAGLPGDSEIIYGGAHIGIMGAVANFGLKRNLKVTGIMPSHLIEKEVGHQGLTQFIKVDSMHSRKQLMYEKSDVFVILPGGFGTLDELFEILTWKQLGMHQKKIIIYNMEGYFSSLIKFISEASQKGFIKKTDLSLLTVCDNLSEIKEELLKVNSHVK
jgi:uncharacterized protein (TIGR00730 family)